MYNVGKVVWEGEVVTHGLSPSIRDPYTSLPEISASILLFATRRLWEDLAAFTETELAIQLMNSFFNLGNRDVVPMRIFGRPSDQDTDDAFLLILDDDGLSEAKSAW